LLRRASPGGVAVSRSPSSSSAEGKPAAPPHLYSRGFSEDPKALEPVAAKVEAELESLVANNVTDANRIAQAVRRTVGKWVGETYRRQPMIVPTVIEV
jgi:ribonuclease J